MKGGKKTTAGGRFAQTASPTGPHSSPSDEGTMARRLNKVFQTHRPEKSSLLCATGMAPEDRRD